MGRGTERNRSSLPPVANIGTDSVLQFAVYEPNIPSFVPTDDAREKWALQLGLSEHAVLPGVTVTEGFPSPLSVFKRQELTRQRQEAVSKGDPLTVIATASGVAKAQLGSFVSFIESAAYEMQKGALQMVIQCGDEAGGGQEVFHVLQERIAQLEKKTPGVADRILLHVAKTPQAAIDFFEALTWSTKPLAMLVKGSEMACMAQSLNIPLILTGAIGDQEYWNVATGMKNQPGLLTIQPGATPKILEGLTATWKNDPLIKAHPAYLTDAMERIRDASPQTIQEVLARVRYYIESGTLAHTNPETMLNILNAILQQKKR